MTDTLAGITLPDDLRWVDEFASWKVAQQVEVSLGGALIIEESAQVTGRPITLQSGGTGTTSWGMATRSMVEALHAHANAAHAASFSLSYQGNTYAVRWRYPDAFSAEPWKHVLPAVSDDLYSINLRLIQV